MNKKTDKINFNYNTSLGEIIKYCKEKNKIFEVNEKGFMLYDFIPNEQKENDKISLGKITQIHVKNQGKKRFSDFGKKPKRISKQLQLQSDAMNLLKAINPIKEKGYVSNCWGEKFPYVKLANNRIIVYQPNNKVVKFTFDPDGNKRFFGEKE
jgi:hypothetical protein